MELALLKYTIVIILGGMLGLLLKRLQQADDDLQMQKISWQEYELLKQAAAGLAFVGMFIGLIICSL